MALLISCGNHQKTTADTSAGIKMAPLEIKVEAETLTNSRHPIDITSIDSTMTFVAAKSEGWIALDVTITKAGRYKTEVMLSSGSNENLVCWIEDYYDNKDDRTYNITGNMTVMGSSSEFSTIHKIGSPLNIGLHKMKLHFNGEAKIDWIKFTLLREHETTTHVLTQNTKGSEWKLVWSDEFDTPMLDTTKWSYDVGNWGWGNNELQYYTEGRTENARIEDGNLIIEARKNDMGCDWTSARLTTRGKTSFVYGKIEFKAKVPEHKGNWAAGWTLGDEYVDELSWPYCGEIDILESVGYEMNDSTGNGIAHASAHCGAYYFKLGNQPTGVIEVENMNKKFHTYAVEWSEEGIKSFVDGQLYITYNDTSTDLSWPFSKPQNIILNLAMGGGWGGYYGLEEGITSQKMTIDYVRVYERR